MQYNIQLRIVYRYPCSNSQHSTVRKLTKTSTTVFKTLSAANASNEREIDQNNSSFIIIFDCEIFQTTLYWVFGLVSIVLILNIFYLCYLNIGRLRAPTRSSLSKMDKHSNCSMISSAEDEQNLIEIDMI